jgi:hypothetical protein
MRERKKAGSGRRRERRGKRRRRRRRRKRISFPTHDTISIVSPIDTRHSSLDVTVDHLRESKHGVIKDK